MEDEPGLWPVALYGALRYATQLGHFGKGKPAEEMEVLATRCPLGSRLEPSTNDRRIVGCMRELDRQVEQLVNQGFEVPLGSPAFTSDQCA
jgi:hypothetical protein